MANVIGPNPFVLDTAHASNILWNHKIKIASIEWRNHNGGADAAELQDQNGKTIARFDAGASVATQNTGFGEGCWFNGLKLPTLNSGKLYIYFL